MTDAKCVYCGASGGQCGHLALIVEGKYITGGILEADVEELSNALCELGEVACTRDELCGEGIVRDAMACAIQCGGCGMDMQSVVSGR